MSNSRETQQCTDAYTEDWDRSDMDMDLSAAQDATQQNSVAFPSEQGGHDSPSTEQRSREPKRTLSDLLKVYAEKGTDVTMNPEEAARVEDVLKAWVSCWFPWKSCVANLSR